MVIISRFFLNRWILNKIAFVEGNRIRLDNLFGNHESGDTFVILGGDNTLQKNLFKFRVGLKKIRLLTIFIFYLLNV